MIQIFFSASLLDILSSSSKLPFICWENKRSENQIKFTGTPYLFLGSFQFQCHQGGEKNVSKKRIFRKTQKEKLKGNHAKPIKIKKLNQPPKKFGCPVTFAVKKIYYFPEYKISTDTKRQRTNASIILRDILSNILKSCEEKKSRDFWTVTVHHMFSYRWIKFLDNDSALHEHNYFPIAIRNCIH